MRCKNWIEPKVDLRIANLETAVTSAETPWPGKGIHYRMHPQNIGCLSAAHISACALANNHVLDWGYDGLSETLQTLDAAGIAHSGADNDCPRGDTARSSKHDGQGPPAFVFHLAPQPAGSNKSGKPPAFLLE